MKTKNSLTISMCKKCNRLLGWRDSGELMTYDFSTTAEYEKCSKDHYSGDTL